MGRVLTAAAIGLLLVLAFASLCLGQDSTLDLPVDKPEAPAPVASRTLGIGVPVNANPHAVLKTPSSPKAEEVRPPTFFGTEIKSENSTIYYVIDFSGSMELPVGDRPGLDGKLVTPMKRRQQAIVEFSRSVLSLPSSFKFNASVYDCSTQVWQGQLVPAHDANKASSIAWINAVPVTYGGTGTAPAVIDALRSKTKLVVLLTDGDPNCPVADLWGPGGTGLERAWHRDQIKANNPNRARINVFGIAASGDMRKFCTDVASDSGGSYQDVK